MQRRHIAIASLLALAACKAPVQDDEITIAVDSPIAGVNALVSSTSNVTQQVIERMFLDLFVENPDSSQGPPEFMPGLAESYEFSDDHLQLTIHVRENAVWSDGVPVTADDVRWTWQAQTSPEIAWPWVDNKQYITDVEVIDDKTVRFHFTHHYAHQLTDVNEGVILPKHAWSQLPFSEWSKSELWFQDHFAGSGPYVLEEFATQSHVTVVANPHYFEADAPVIKRVVFKVVPEPITRLLGLMGGELDFIAKLQPHEAEEIGDAGTVIPYQHRQYDHITWNLRDPLLSDPRMRRALTMAIDRQQIIDGLLGGYSKPSTGPIISNVWAHSGIEPWPYDPEQALDLLAGLGWTWGRDDVLQDQSGNYLGFMLAFNGDNAFRRNAATVIQQQLFKIGVRALLDPVESGTLIDRIYKGQFQAYIGGFTMDTSLDLTTVFHSDSIEDGYNFGGYSNPELDELIERIKRYPNILDARNDLVRAQEIIHQDLPMTFLSEPMRIDAHSERLENVKPNLLDSYANLRYWRVDNRKGGT